MFDSIRLFNQLVPAGAKKKGPTGTVSQLFYDFMLNFESPWLFPRTPSRVLKTLDDMLLEQKGLSRASIDQKVEERIKARTEKNYALSDKLRDELNQMGIDIRDSAEGTLWK